MKCKIALLVLSVILSGCAGKLRPDESMPATTAHYDTAEILACGKRFHGLGVCFLEKGEDIASLAIKVQGYYQGTVQWFSEGCKVNHSVEYKKNEVVSLNLSGEIAKSCIISVLVSPRYPVKSDREIYSFRGHLAVKLNPRGDRLGETRKLSGGWQDNLTIPVQGGTSATVVLRGCNAEYRATHPVVNGFVKVPLRAATSLKEGALCLLDGFALNQQSETSVSVLIRVYNRLFVPLSLPVVTEHRGRLNVVGEPSVSIVALDNEYEMDQTASFDFYPHAHHVLRLLTVKGRSVVCDYLPGPTLPPPGPQGTWECKQ